MAPALFKTITLDGLELKNRIVMSPMCMYSTEGDGLATDFHVVHYVSRAIGQVGLIILEVCAVDEKGLGNPHELGIWSDEHIQGLKRIVDLCHLQGAKVGVQIGHAGRKSELPDQPIAPSAIPFDHDRQTPRELSISEIQELVNKFKKAAVRADQAGFDLIEIHGAHGYLINQFLSPLTNHRSDQYGGGREKRYQFLKEIIDAIKEVWKKPLFVRVSANEFHEDGNKMEDIAYFSEQMKRQGVSLITCSAGGVVPAKVEIYPGYEVPYSDFVKNRVGIPTGAVGLITEPFHAEEILRNNRADLIVLGRELLRNPHWAYHAARQLGFSIESPRQYKRGWNFEMGRALK